jgi:hypothetical protein
MLRRPALLLLAAAAAWGLTAAAEEYGEADDELEVSRHEESADEAGLDEGLRSFSFSNPRSYGESC